MPILFRLLQSLPLVIVLIILAIVVYFVVSWLRSPRHAKAALIKLFTVLTIALSVVFALASAYALLENNMVVLELTGGFLAVAVVALIVTRICRWCFVKNNPNFRWESTETHYLD